MSETAQFHDLVVLMALAVAAPLLTRLAKRIRVSAVVLEILLGILVGPELLGWVQVDGVIESFAIFGLAFLFFLAGFEIDPSRLRGPPLRMASVSWVGSLAVALAVGAVLATSGVVLDSVIVGLALATTALGMLLPILRDQGEMTTDFGNLVTANGAVGEFGPIVAIALLLAGNNPLFESLLLVTFLVLVALTLWVSRRRRPEWLDGALRSRPALEQPAADPPLPAAGRAARVDRRRARTRPAPGRVRRWRGDPCRRERPARRSRRGAVLREAGGDRLRHLHPDLLRRHRGEVRRRGPGVVGQHDAQGAALPLAPPAGARRSRVARPSVRRVRPRADFVGAVQRDGAAPHRGHHPHRRRDRSHASQQRHRPGGRRHALRAHLPGGGVPAPSGPTAPYRSPAGLEHHPDERRRRRPTVSPDPPRHPELVVQRRSDAAA